MTACPAAADATSRDVERASDVVTTALALASSVLESGLEDSRLRELYPEVGESDWEDIVSVADLIAQSLLPDEEAGARARRRLEDAAGGTEEDAERPLLSTSFTGKDPHQ